MLRRAFLRRMALAAAACAFIDVPWPKVRSGSVYVQPGNSGSWSGPYDVVRVGEAGIRIHGWRDDGSPIVEGFGGAHVIQTDGGRIGFTVGA